MCPLETENIEQEPENNPGGLTKSRRLGGYLFFDKKQNFLLDLNLLLLLRLHPSPRCFDKCHSNVDLREAGSPSHPRPNLDSKAWKPFF